MEPSEYMLVPNRNYKRVATWSYKTDLKHNEKNTQTVINGLNLDVKYRTQLNSEMSSSLLLFTSQLDNSVEDDGPKPGSTAMDCTGTSGGLSLSFRDESMRMERLLGSICQPLLYLPCTVHCLPFPEEFAFLPSQLDELAGISHLQGALTSSSLQCYLSVASVPLQCHDQKGTL